MGDDTTFARLVSLACHDLRTPLATVIGFARTLQRIDSLGEPASRYVEMIGAASEQLTELLDELGLVARIEAGRYDPRLTDVDSLELARGAAERLGEDRVGISGEGGPVRVDENAAPRAVAALAQCALRHGGFERVELAVRGTELRLTPVTPASAPVLLGEDLRDLGAAVGVQVLRALGSSVALDGDALRIALPSAQ